MASKCWGKDLWEDENFLGGERPPITPSPFRLILRNQSIKRHEKPLNVVSAISLLVCFLSLKESTCETRKNVFYLTSKALFVLDKIKF